jgi:Cu(I)/Ag(I) efflux system membrane fusion protein
MNRPRPRSSRTRGVITLIAIALSAFALGALWGGGGSREATQHAEEAALWTCSMHPQFQLEEPGKCPICFMDLIPSSSGTAAAGAQGPRDIALTPDAAALMRVETSPVERRSVSAQIQMVGQVDFDESRVTAISAWVPGRLERLFVDYTGMTVKRGDPMVELYSPDLLAAQEELLQALHSAQQSDPAALPAMHQSMVATVDAVREKLRRWGLSAAQIAAIESRGHAQDRVTIHAPAGGVVIEKLATQGMYVTTGTPIYKMADLSEVWIHLDAYESDLAWLRDGQSVRFEAAALPGNSFEGTISLIHPVFKDATRTVRVRVIASNAEALLKPGMFVRATAESTLAAQRIGSSEGGLRDEANLPLVIPATAPLLTGSRAVVYVELPDATVPTYEGREVVLGARAGDYYVVTDGLTEGDRVVTRGAFKLDAELQLQARPSMMSPSSAPGAQPAAPAAPHPQTHCPVMGGEITREVFLDYKGERIYFCCPGCNEVFLEEPQKHLDAMRAAGVVLERVAPARKGEP